MRENLDVDSVVLSMIGHVKRGIPSPNMLPDPDPALEQLAKHRQVTSVLV